MTLESWATAQAERLIGALGDRWMHVQAVADKARSVAVVLSAADADLLVAAALVHDVGTLPHWIGSASTPSTVPGFFAPGAKSGWLGWSPTTLGRALRPRSAAWSRSWPPSRSRTGRSWTPSPSPT
jgi:hypothetical protein